MIEFDRPKPLTNGLKIVSLLDVIFLLLLFFILTSVFLDPGLPLDLPEAVTAAFQEAQPEVIIYITRLGELSVNDQPVPLEHLPAALTKMFSAGAAKQVTLKADKEVAFGLFVQVLDIAKAAGGENLTIAAQFPE